MADRIEGMGGDDTMHGDSQRGDGVPVPNATDDRCDGGPGTDAAIDCEHVIGVP